MKLTGKHIVVTGGTTGIGFALAQALLAKDNDVLAVDYSETNIREAKDKLPKLKTIKADLSEPASREQLMAKLEMVFPDYDILINNAGIQRWINLQNSHQDWAYYHQELAINFEAPVHLSMLAIDHLRQSSEAAIINISSGLVINPGAWVPLYTAGKTGVHGFTQALRLQLQDTDIKVFEVFPPAVNTGLGGTGEHEYGVSLAEFIPAVTAQIENNQFEITYGTSRTQYNASKEVNRQTTQETWDMFKNNSSFLQA
ncbi:SDR family oxidoreductase [Agrilactobacillus fermenti]|uniref:SDR family oxidoreductase n=1 Tax=Agrilactobacillus fermenti TaxID=2586909 RepID=UPI003A5BE3E5